MNRENQPCFKQMGSRFPLDFANNDSQLRTEEIGVAGLAESKLKKCNYKV